MLWHHTSSSKENFPASVSLFPQDNVQRPRYAAPSGLSPMTVHCCAAISSVFCQNQRSCPLQFEWFDSGHHTGLDTKNFFIFFTFWTQINDTTERFILMCLFTVNIFWWRTATSACIFPSDLQFKNCLFPLHLVSKRALWKSMELNHFLSSLIIWGTSLPHWLQKGKLEVSPGLKPDSSIQLLCI